MKNKSHRKNKRKKKKMTASNKEYQDKVDIEMSFEEKKYGIYHDDEVKIVVDQRMYGPDNVIQGRYLSTTDEMVAIVSNEDNKVHWLSLDYIVEVTCIFHRKEHPDNNETKVENITMHR